MGRALGVSASYVNLLENNQRSLSVSMLMALADVYGVDWREFAKTTPPICWPTCATPYVIRCSARMHRICRNCAPPSITHRKSCAASCSCIAITAASSRS